MLRIWLKIIHMHWSNKRWLLKWYIVLERSRWNCNGEKIKIHFIENWKRLNMMRDCECLHTITSLIRLLNVVCVISKSKLIGGAYNIHILYTCTNTAFFFYNIHDSIIPCIEREIKKIVQTCLRWIKKWTDWLLIFIPSYFFSFDVWFQWHQDACYWFFFLSFFLLLCVRVEQDAS